jgi:phosphoribosylamine---glycine ligase
MRVLVVGAGGREHALLRAAARSSHEPELLCAPGNAGIAADGVTCLEIGVDEVGAIVSAARDEAVDLVIVGPEAPLVAGLVDALEDEGIAAFGPSGEAAEIEGSKLFAKELMEEAGVPTASHTVLRTQEEALEQISQQAFPAVMKADGLAAGKGVIICETEEQAREAAAIFFEEERFGTTEVVLEEFLEGEELSLLAICDGDTVVPLAPAQDYKRIGDGDEGPNTGGMGSYSPVPGFDREEVDRIVDEVHRPVVETMAKRGIPYRGVLYAGLMVNDGEAKVLEFNCRFGDPETQAVLPRLDSDLIDLCLGSRTDGGLTGVSAEFSDDWAVTLVLASDGYPASSSKGDAISGLEEAAAIEGVEITHAGTAMAGGEVVTAGGRVLNVTGLGPSPADARQRAYDAANLISFEGMQLRTDIAARAVERVAAG